MTLSPTACTVFVNGSSVGDCANNPILRNYFALPQWWFFVFYGAIGGVVVVTALLLITKHRQRPYGRFLEGFTGIIGVGQAASGANAIGKVIPFIDTGLALFDPGPGKGKFKKIITVMPDSIIVMPQSLGGVAFTFVNLDKRTTVDIHTLEWTQGVLKKLAKNLRFDEFVFGLKLRELQEAGKIGVPQRRFPPTNGDGEQTVILVGADGQEYTKKVSELDAQEAQWYDRVSREETANMDRLKDLQERGPELKAKIEAALSNSKTYHFNGQKQPFDGVQKTTLYRALLKELSGRTDSIATAVFGGFTVSAQHVADVLAGIPSAAYIRGIQEEIEKKIRLEIKDSWKNYIPLAVIAGLMVGAIVLVGFILK